MWVSNKNIRDQKLRKLAAKYELKRMLYKAICQDRNLSDKVRNKALEKLSLLLRNSSFTRVRNRRIFTGRSRSVYQLFRMSRIVSRELASKGSLIGINKSCW
nr:ribosomal protein S subunit 14 [Haplopteris ensiformis]UQV94667.1 ribosomal protein S subunit 14 [Haplopteris ensiformis]UQV94695.1 ribosomal protein S subunit 14 [Haplopteris ensiformis]UQV94703.1 ribosomal protein S subunit 14 [Haplopteris ensiformis]UQV94722.1 ribosomal protein S subunit 14 [Haplopteris ensiformis]